MSKNPEDCAHLKLKRLSFDSPMNEEHNQYVCCDCGTLYKVEPLSIQVSYGEAAKA